MQIPLQSARQRMLNLEVMPKQTWSVEENGWVNEMTFFVCKMSRSFIVGVDEMDALDIEISGRLNLFSFLEFSRARRRENVKWKQVAPDHVNRPTSITTNFQVASLSFVLKKYVQNCGQIFLG